tara:strand:+ start:2238 stop:3107 length:870 start_codon:yes stop_codon:yes gene_type:complete
MGDELLRVRYAERVRAVEHFERTWWSTDEGPQSGFLREHPEVYPRIIARMSAGLPVETRHVYADDAGLVWADERLELHDRILDDMDQEDGSSRGSGEGAVYFLLGLPGSGKSTSLRPIAMVHSRTSGSLPCSDADAVRSRFPEYAGGLGSGVVQTETVVVTYGVSYRAGDGRQQRVLANGRDVIVDVIGDPDRLPETVLALAGVGRPVYLLMSSCSAETCKQRVMARALDNGRYVPTWLVDEKVGVPERAFELALKTGGVTGWAVVDTEGSSTVIGAGGALDSLLQSSD